MRINISSQQATLLLVNEETNEFSDLITEFNDHAYIEGTEIQIDDLRSRCSDLLMRIGFKKMTSQPRLVF